MSEPDDRVSATVVYSRDKWRMGWAPWALWLCAAGLAVVLHTSDRTGNGALLAWLYLLLLGLAFAGWAVTTLIDRSRFPVYVTLPAVIVIALLVSMIIGLWGAPGLSGNARGSAWWSNLVNPPPNVFGWMLMYLGAGWVAYAVYRHFHPERPAVVLSSSGVSFHRPWLADLFIPWREIRETGPLSLSDTDAPGSTVKGTAAVVVSNAFYQRVIAPKVRSFAPPQTEFMFRPKADAMQMVLTCPELAVKAEDFLHPLAARLSAFGSAASEPVVLTERPQTTIIYGRWSPGGSWWQVIALALPVAAMIAIALHGSGVWHR